MSTPISLETVRKRSESFARDNYLFLGSVIRGVVLATATYAGFRIFGDLPVNWPRAILFAASFSAIIISHVTWGRGVLLTNARANIFDTVLPLWIGVMEFSLFGVTIPDKDYPTAWHWWFLVLALHSIGAVALVANRLALTDIDADFEEPLRRLAIKYKGWMKTNLIGASIASVAALLIWTVMKYYVSSPAIHDKLYAAFAAVAGLLLWVPICTADNERSQIGDFVAGKEIDSLS